MIQEYLFRKYKIETQFNKSHVYLIHCHDTQEKHMFWSLFILCKHLTRGPASNACDDEQGDPYFIPQVHKVTCISHTKTRKKFVEDLEQKELNGPVMWKIRKEQIPSSGQSMNLCPVR